MVCRFLRLIILSNVKQCSAKSVTMQESEPAKTPVNLEEIRAELKAKIEEEAYNKGWDLLSWFFNTHTHTHMPWTISSVHHKSDL